MKEQKMFIYAKAGVMLGMVQELTTAAMAQAEYNITQTAQHPNCLQCGRPKVERLDVTMAFTSRKEAEKALAQVRLQFGMPEEENLHLFQLTRTRALRGKKKTAEKSTGGEVSRGGRPHGSRSGGRPRGVQDSPPDRRGPTVFPSGKPGTEAVLHNQEGGEDS